MKKIIIITLLLLTTMLQAQEIDIISLNSNNSKNINVQIRDTTSVTEKHIVILTSVKEYDAFQKLCEVYTEGNSIDSYSIVLVGKFHTLVIKTRHKTYNIPLAPLSKENKSIIEAFVNLIKTKL